MKKILFIFFVVTVLAACAKSEPFEYHRIDEIPEGPGLFSGEDGEFTLYSK